MYYRLHWISVEAKFSLVLRDRLLLPNTAWHLHSCKGVSISDNFPTRFLHAILASEVMAVPERHPVGESVSQLSSCQCQAGCQILMQSTVVMQVLLTACM